MEFLALFFSIERKGSKSVLRNLTYNYSVSFGNFLQVCISPKISSDYS